MIPILEYLLPLKSNDLAKDLFRKGSRFLLPCSEGLIQYMRLKSRDVRRMPTCCPSRESLSLERYWFNAVALSSSTGQCGAEFGR